MKSNVMGLTVLASLLFVGSASAESTALDTSDNVAISFWIATAMMLASTIFFLVERSNVAPKWRTSVTVAALVTGVAWYHYTYMRDHWVMTGESPLVLRYIDWLITVPLQVVWLHGCILYTKSGPEMPKKLLKKLPRAYSSHSNG